MSLKQPIKRMVWQHKKSPTPGHKHYIVLPSAKLKSACYTRPLSLVMRGSSSLQTMPARSQILFRAAMIRRRNVLKLFFICAILTTITNFPSGFTNSSVNTAVEELKEFINGSYVERGWVLQTTHQTLVRSATLNCWFIAQIIGSLFSPFLTDHYGRKSKAFVEGGLYMQLFQLPTCSLRV